MSKNNMGEMLTGLTPDMKKEIVLSLVASLLSDLNDQGKKDFLKSALEGRKKGRDLIDMVAH